MKLGAAAARGAATIATAAAVAAVVAALMALPFQTASAQTAQTTTTSPNLRLPASNYLGACAGKTPVVVASDQPAQSDIYSAITLAGVLGTDCVILAGPRHTDLPADQRTRLVAANSGGYVVGGSAAVPNWKVAGRSMVRIAGADRWQTAELVGAEAKKAGQGSPSTPTVIWGQRPSANPSPAPDTASRLRLPPANYLGACAGQTPIVVASDQPAQSDIYSAITLAGVLETDCIILAGTRDSPIDSTQTSRLADANSGGYVVGGTAAVPNWKANGRVMVRIAGADRWQTAELVGAEAKKVGAGSPSDPRAIFGTRPTAASVNNLEDVRLSAYGIHSCATNAKNTVACWGSNEVGQASPPSGSFKAVSAGGSHSCAIGSNDRLACWGQNLDGQASPPSGSFKAVSAGGFHTCAIRSDAKMTCWGAPGNDQTDAPSGAFKAVSAGDVHSCAIHTNGRIVCWGANFDGRTNSPSGTFAAVSAGGHHSCAIATNTKIACWGRGREGQTDAPNGSFKSVSAGGFHTCAIRFDDTLTCWGRGRDGQTDAPSGSFIAVSVGELHSCAMRSGGQVVCWGDNAHGQTDAP